MTQENTGNELAIAKNIENYPALAGKTDRLEIVKEALAGAKLSVFGDLSRIHVPSGGGIAWEVPDVTKKGGVGSADTITGIVISNQYSRSYWEKPYGGIESGPPDCSSWDMDGFGIGNPGGDCFSCPFNEFGTAVRGDGSDARGKACAEKRFIFMLTERSFLPVVVQVAVTSMRPFTHFSLAIGDTMGLRLRQIVVDLTLKKENKSGFPTSIIVPSFNARLSDEDQLKVVELMKQLAPIMPGRTSPVRAKGNEEFPDEEFLDDDDSVEEGLPF